MTRTPDMFPDTKPKRKSPRPLAHVMDAGNAEGTVWAQMGCCKGHVFEVFGKYTVTELKRGLPCEECAAKSP